MPLNVTIYHNPACSKSRETLALLKERSIQPKIVNYLSTPPDEITLNRLIQQLGYSSARQLMRRKDNLYTKLQLDDPTLSEKDLISAMIIHPILIERPIVVCNDQARVGRPPEQILTIIE